jgi:molecular chaperone DnaK
MGIWGRGRLRHSVGIETKGGRFTPLIKRGTRLPVSLTETFTTADPEQTSIKIHPFQGERRRTAGNTSLGLFEVIDIPPGGPGEPLIEVTFHVDAQGKLTITARDAAADERLPVRQR